MNTNETVSPTGGKGSADYDVYSVFRQDITPVRKLIIAAIVMQIIFFGPILCAFLFPRVQILQNMLFLIVPSILVALALAFPFIPGIIVLRHFRDAVIPACRYTCSEKDVSGAFQCLRFMWGRYILCLLPGILILFCFLFRLFYRPSEEAVSNIEYSGGTGLYILGISVFLLGECALAVFPVARIFSRRAGMIVMIPFIIPGQIVLIMNYLTRIVGLLYDVPEKEYISQSIIIFAVCAVLFGGALAYFIHAAKKDSEGCWMTDL